MKDIESYRLYCLSKPATTESSPFGPETIVFKVMNKMYATLSLTGSDTSNLKGDPERNLELRDEFISVKPGYHMNKKHWNTINFSGDGLSVEDVKEMVDHSYDLVVQGLTKKEKEELKEWK